MRRSATPCVVLVAALAGLAACEKSADLLPAAVEKDTFNVHPSDQPQVLTNSTGKAAVKLAANTVNENTKVVLTLLDPTAAAPLNTKLDKYPAYVLISSSSPLSKPAVVAVCPPANIPAAVRDRLRLGHQPSGGFEITPQADGSFLDCSGVASSSRLPSWLKALASLVLPKPLYARLRATGGVGGSATEFSPFGPVDPELRVSGGVGGTATEFQQSGGANTNKVPGAVLNTVVNGVCTSVDAPAGSALEKECRPGMTLKTEQGTILTNVPIAWAVTGGGGTVASEASGTRTCGTFGANASTTTNVSGKAGACWTLGANIGANTVVATPSAGGDAPLGVTFSPPNKLFTATGLKITPVASATGGEFTFDGLAHPGAGACSNGLVPALAYTPGGATPPKNIGNYVLLVTCGAGQANFNTATATASISIAAIPATINITCPATVAYTGSALTPCSATVTGGGLNQAVVPEYSSNVNAGTATAAVNFQGDGSVGAANASRTFQITTAPSATTMACATNVVYNATVQNPCDAAVTGVGNFRQPVTVSYSPALPRLPGAYTATATFVASGNFQGSTITKAFAIAKAPATATAGSGGMLPDGTVPALPCTVTGLFGTDAGTVTCTTSVPSPLALGPNPTTAVVSPAIPANYLVTGVAGTLTVGFVQAGCFGPPLQAAIPPTSQGVAKGASFTVSCRLLNPSGGPVLNATSVTDVHDQGATGAGPSVLIHSQANEFTVSADGTYAFVLSTSGGLFVPGRYYRVTTSWSDGSSSVGWFYLTP